MTSKRLQLLLNFLILGTFGSLLAFSEGPDAPNVKAEIKRTESPQTPPAKSAAERDLTNPSEWLPMCIMIASKEKDKTSGPVAPLKSTPQEEGKTKGVTGMIQDGLSGIAGGISSTVNSASGAGTSAAQALEINSALKEMAAAYAKCDIGLKFHVFRIDPKDLENQRNLDPEQLQKMAKSGCNFQETYGVRGATQLFITNEFKPPPQPDGNGNGGTIDYDNFPQAMCRNPAASGCSTLCEPASFSAVVLGGGGGAQGAITSIHESLHSNCCGRACLNIDDGRVQKLGGAMDNLYEIGVGPEPRRRAALTFRRWHADTGVNANRATQQAEFLEAYNESKGKPGTLPDLNPVVCESLKRGAAKNPGAIKYDPKKDYLVENVIALANGRSLLKGKNLLPVTDETKIAGSAAEIKKYVAEQKKNTDLKMAEFKEYYDKMGSDLKTNRLDREKTREELRRESSRKAGADEAMGKAADTAQVQEGSNTPSSDYVFMGDKNGDGGTSNSQSSSPAQAVSIPAIVPQTSGLASTNPSGGPQNGVGLMPSGNKGTGLYFKENLKGVRGLAGSSDGVNSQNTQRGATTGANGAKIVPKNRNGDSIETVTEDLLRAKPSITNRTPNNNRQIPGDYE